MQVTPVFVLLLVLFDLSQMVSNGPLQSWTLKDRAQVTTVEAAFVYDFLTSRSGTLKFVAPFAKVSAMTIMPSSSNPKSLR